MRMEGGAPSVAREAAVYPAPASHPGYGPEITEHLHKPVA